ncbi:MAG: hypothetical protein AMXMBFR7_48090 [Planctomycetota bacterium]
MKLFVVLKHGKSSTFGKSEITEAQARLPSLCDPSHEHSFAAQPTPNFLKMLPLKAFLVGDDG